MEDNIKKLQDERIENFNNIFRGIVPHNVPVNVFLTNECIAGKYGTDIMTVAWNQSAMAESADKACQDFYSDICPYKGANRLPYFYELLGSVSYLLTESGVIQHPEVHCMEPDEYDEFIANPFDTIVSKFLPRNFKAMDVNDPFRMAMQISKAILSKDDDFKEMGAITSKLMDKYGYYHGVRGADGFCPAPFDFIADELRGFSGMSVDMRRQPEKVVEACEAIYPLVIKSAMPDVIDDSGHVSMMLHMPSFMKTKDFEKFYWPSWSNMLNEFASMGIHSYGFCEANWDRYVDYLAELPVNTYLGFEAGDYKMIKERLGKRHILMGFYPMELLRVGTKEQCLDKAKELLDVMAIDGRYIFKYDKGPIVTSDINWENADAVNKFVVEYTKYKNFGEKIGEEFHKEDYKAVEHKEFESKYWKTLDDQKKEYAYINDYAAKRLQKYEDKLARFYKGIVS